MDRAACKVECQIVLTVTVAYCILFLFTITVVMPLQDVFFHWLPMNISLLFLPHGVRLLTIYLYGLRAIFYLLPGHLLTWSYLWFVLQSEQDISASLISILAGFLAVCLVFRTWNYHSDSELRSHWKLIILAGVLASIGNGLGHATLYGLQLDVNWLILALGFLIGDVSGLFFLMVTLILINRFARVRSL